MSTEYLLHEKPSTFHSPRTAPGKTPEEILEYGRLLLVEDGWMTGELAMAVTGPQSRCAVGALLAVKCNWVTAVPRLHSMDRGFWQRDRDEGDANPAEKEAAKYLYNAFEELFPRDMKEVNWRDHDSYLLAIEEINDSKALSERDILAAFERAVVIAKEAAAQSK